MWFVTCPVQKSLQLEIDDFGMSHVILDNDYKLFRVLRFLGEPA